MTQVHIDKVEVTAIDGVDHHMAIYATWTHPVQGSQVLDGSIVYRPRASPYLDAPNQTAKDAMLNGLVMQIVQRDRLMLDNTPPPPPPPQDPPVTTEETDEVDRDLNVP